MIDEVGRCLARRFEKAHPEKHVNTWNLNAISCIKQLFDSNPEEAKKKYPELFYYYDGLLDVVISQSVHPAGMVISPITLRDNFGVFDKDGEPCLMLDMENIHDYTGLAKYDFLILSTVTRIRDTCRLIGTHYPRTHEIDWNDEAVWDDMLISNTGLFQFESAYGGECLRRMKPRNIFEMCMVTACIRPTGASYRDELLARKQHKNPSSLIDDVLSDSNGFLVYQEQTIAFLQQVCGLSGSEADNIRRAIGRFLPRIVEI